MRTGPAHARRSATVVAHGFENRRQCGLPAIRTERLPGAQASRSIAVSVFPCSRMPSQGDFEAGHCDGRWKRTSRCARGRGCAAACRRYRTGKHPACPRQTGSIATRASFVQLKLSAYLQQGAQPWRYGNLTALNTGRSLRGGRLRPARTSASSRPSSAIARLNVLRWMPNSSAALHWLPRCADQHFAQILPLEFAYGILVADAAGMHLCHQAVQFSSHVHLLLL